MEIRTLPLSGLFIILVSLLSQRSMAGGIEQITCVSENTALHFDLASSDAENSVRKILTGSVRFFGVLLPIDPNDNGYVYHSELKRVVLENGKKRDDYYRFGGYQLLGQTGFYKVLFSIDQNRFEVRGVDRKIPISEEDLIESGTCERKQLPDPTERSN